MENTDLLKDKGAAIGGATAGIAKDDYPDAEHGRSRAVDAAAIAQLFTEARTHHAFRDLPVSDALLRKALDLDNGNYGTRRDDEVRAPFITIGVGPSGLRLRTQTALMIFLKGCNI